MSYEFDALYEVRPTSHHPGPPFPASCCFGCLPLLSCSCLLPPCPLTFAWFVVAVYQGSARAAPAAVPVSHHREQQDVLARGARRTTVLPSQSLSPFAPLAFNLHSNSPPRALGSSSLPQSTRSRVLIPPACPRRLRSCSRPSSSASRTTTRSPTPTSPTRCVRGPAAASLDRHEVHKARQD